MTQGGRPEGLRLVLHGGVVALGRAVMGSPGQSSGEIGTRVGDAGGKEARRQNRGLCGAFQRGEERGCQCRQQGFGEFFAVFLKIDLTEYDLRMLKCADLN